MMLMMMLTMMLMMRVEEKEKEKEEKDMLREKSKNPNLKGGEQNNMKMNVWRDRLSSSLAPTWAAPFLGVPNSGAPIGLQITSKPS